MHASSVFVVVAVISSIAGVSFARSHGGAERTLYVTRGAPLAVVDDGRIRSAGCGPRSSATRGNRVGDVWTRLDVWGRPVEAARVVNSSVYDLTDCREIALSGKPDEDAQPALFVRGPASPASVAANGARRFACASEKDHPSLGAAFTAATGARAPLLFCTQDESGTDVVRAVAAGERLVFARMEASQWIVERTVAVNAKDRPTQLDRAFAVIAVLDMNGDGAPEVVVHSRQSDSYEDAIYTLGPRGAIRRVVSHSGGYA
jgi:hypothetical protein